MSKKHQPTRNHNLDPKLDLLYAESIDHNIHIVLVLLCGFFNANLNPKQICVYTIQIITIKRTDDIDTEDDNAIPQNPTNVEQKTF